MGKVEVCVGKYLLGGPIYVKAYISYRKPMIFKMVPDLLGDLHVARR